MSNVPLPEPVQIGLEEYDWNTFRPALGYTADQMHAYAAAVSAADNAALRAELAKHQESEFHPDWSMLAATRESLREHQQMIVALRERVRVLEGALEGALKWGAALSPDEHAKCRAALKRED